MLGQPTASALSHLLAQSGWAAKRLAPHAGKTVCFQIAPFSFSYTIQDDGSVSAAAEATSADAVCTIPPSLLPRLAVQDESAYLQIENSGDAALLAEIFYLSRHLRWDAAEDLSHLTGDIAAERMVQYADAGRRYIQHTATVLSHALAEFWTEEDPLLAKSTQISSFVHQTDKLRDDVARLEQRIHRLNGS